MQNAAAATSLGAVHAGPSPARYPETPIGALGLYAATCTEPLGYGSAGVQRACGDSWPELAEDLRLFSQEDPIRFRAGLNFYRYVENNPTSFADAFGLETGATFRSQWCMETGSCGLPPPSRTPDEIYDEALRRARETGLPGGWNGPQDAFRHCLGSCMMTRELGETTATFYGWANEKRGDWQKNQETGEREMDDANNACGRRAGRDARSTEDCAARCMFAVHSRELTTYYRRGSTPGYRDK